VEYTMSKSSDQEKTLHCSGQFTFSDNQKFRTILKLIEDRTLSTLTLDFSDVLFIDSSGLGMLLLLRDECTNRNISFTLSRPQGQVEKIFLISRFDEIFTIKN